MSAGLGSTVLPQAEPDVRAALDEATGADGASRRDAIAAVVAANPKTLQAWAALGHAGRDTIERYAAYRIGYHRGLDALRAHGWRGSGYVRWSEPSNRGFLECLAGLAEMANAIGETDEAERCQLFLSQLDPDRWPPSGPPDR